MQRPCGRKEHSRGTGALKRLEIASGHADDHSACPTEELQGDRGLVHNKFSKKIKQNTEQGSFPDFPMKRWQQTQRPLQRRSSLTAPPASWMQIHPLITIKYQEPRGTCLGGRGSFLPKLWSVSTVFQMEIRQLNAGT